MPDDNLVESIRMNFNLFTRLDIIRSRTLQRLYLNHNKIQKPVATEANYQSLVELSIANNGIQVLDLTVLELPKLAVLDVSINSIAKIITKRSASGDKAATLVTLQHLRSLNLRTP